MKRLVTAAALFAALFSAPAAHAQTGMARGKVVDEKEQAMSGVKVTWEFQGGVTRKGEVTTNKKGEFIQVGLQSGNYRFTVSVAGYQPETADLRVSLGDATLVPDFAMKPKAAATAVAASRERLEDRPVTVQHQFFIEYDRDLIPGWPRPITE